LNTELEYLNCSANPLNSLDLSMNIKIGYPYLHNFFLWNMIGMDDSFLRLMDMPSLHKVCVWESFHPDSIVIDTTGSPNVYFSDCGSPQLYVTYDQYQAQYVEATSTEDGMIYLVPYDTDNDIAHIREACIDSALAVANSPVSVSLSGLDNGLYWLYACDSTGNISDPKDITIMGVAIDKVFSDQLRIFPNPTYDLTTIQTKEFGQYTISLNSMNGQLVFSIRMEGTTQQVDLSAFQKGIYFITIRSKDFVTTRKIIKL